MKTIELAAYSLQFVHLTQMITSLSWTKWDCEIFFLFQRILTIHILSLSYNLAKRVYTTQLIPSIILFIKFQRIHLGLDITDSKCAPLSLCSGLDKFYHSGGEESSRKSSRGEDLVPLVQNGENLTDWGHTTSHLEDQCGTSGCQSDSWAMSTTWDMQLDSTGEKGHRLERRE